MVDSPAVSIEAAPTEIRSGSPPNQRRLRWFEVCLVLLVSCGAPLLNSLYLLRNRPGAMPHVSNARWIIGIVQELTGLLLLGYVLSRRKLRFKDLGLRWSLRDVGTGLLLILASYATYALGWQPAQHIRFAIYASAADGPRASDFFAHPSVFAIAFHLLNPFFEELIVRAYLMPEIMDLTGSSALAIALSVVVQSSYHLYYRWAGAVSLSFVFFVFALYFARARQVLPLIVAHGFFDIYGLVRLW
jgi:membrane protease YdiL (CAAX protease family)